jgi:hypothetical protein
LKNTIADNKRFTKPPIAKMPNWRYFFEILAKLGLNVENGICQSARETALQEENDQVRLNGVNCRNSLRVNCSTIELGTRGILDGFWSIYRSRFDFVRQSSGVLVDESRVGL